jgi:hypothetical protein
MPLYPACQRLSKILTDYLDASSAAGELESKLARATADEENTASDSGLTEDDAIAKVAEAQSRKSVYSARLVSRQRAVATLATELWDAVKGVNQERGTLVAKLISERMEILSARVIEAVGAVDRPGRGAVLQELLVGYSAPIEQARRLEPPVFLSMPGPESLASTAENALAGYKQIIAEAAKTI